MSRKENSLRNIRYALAGQIIATFVNFVARMVFVRVLTAEYLGLNGLFSNILTLLSIADLGIGSAIVFSMFEPLAQQDTQRLRALLGFYRRIYLAIGIIVGGLGALLTPLLPFIIKEIPDIPNIETIYLLFVANSAISYFVSYKSSLLFADQKQYVVTMYSYGFFVVRSLLQITILVTTGDYLLFLVTQVVFTLFQNIAVSRRVDRMYPYILERPVPSIGPADRDTLGRNVKAMVFHRLGAAVLLGTDSIVMAKFVGIVAVGLYSNYLLITSALNVVLIALFSALTGSVGNLGVEASKEKQIETFKMLDLSVFWAYSFASISLFVLLNPFIGLWLGAAYLFEWPVVLAIAVNFYLTGVRNSVGIFKQAKGIFWPDRFRPLGEIAVNLVFSVVLAQHLGVLGVLIGTALSTILVCLPVEPYMLFKHGFALSVRGYYRRYLLYSTLTIAAGVTTWAASGWILVEGWGGPAIKLMLCLAIPNAVNWLVLARRPECRRLVSVLKSFRSK